VEHIEDQVADVQLLALVQPPVGGRGLDLEPCRSWPA